MSAPNLSVDSPPWDLPAPSRLRTAPGRHGDPTRGLRHAPGRPAAAPDRSQDAGREQRLRAAAERVVDSLPQLADALASLVELAEFQDEPRLQRFAALTRSRADAVVSLVRGLEDAIGEVPAEPQTPVSVADLRTVVHRAATTARMEAGGAADVRAEFGDHPLPVRCDAAAVERSVAALLSTALHHSRALPTAVLRLTEATAYGVHARSTGRPATTCRLTLAAERSSVTTGELARMVARFHRILGEESAEPARIGVSADAVVVESGSVHGEASRARGLLIHVDWPLERGPLTVIPGRRSPSAPPRAHS